LSSSNIRPNSHYMAHNSSKNCATPIFLILSLSNLHTLVSEPSNQLTQEKTIPNPKTFTHAVLASACIKLQFALYSTTPNSLHQQLWSSWPASLPSISAPPNTCLRRRPTPSHQPTPLPLKTSIYATRASISTAASLKEGPIPGPCHSCLIVMRACSTS
jgi:hypothetical protein